MVLYVLFFSIFLSLYCVFISINMDIGMDIDIGMSIDIDTF